MAEIVERATTTQPPIIAQQYEDPRVRLLVGICRELQRHAGGGTFYLSTRTAGQLVGIHHSRAARWLRGLVFDEVLELANKGDRAGRRAAEFRYLGD